jgi:pimeloyl-ACP methyl ester carboxylesterase
MNKFKVAFLLLLFIALCINTFAQSPAKPFEVIKSGKGDKSIIFIPGFACSGAVWDETKACYEKSYTCYTLTMAGFAGITPQPGATFKNWETGIADYIKENKIEKPIIIGHSMGGGLALALASDYPALIDKIVVVDALPCLNALMNPAFKKEAHPDCSAMVNKTASMTDGQFYQVQKMSVSRLLEDTSKQELVVSWSVKSDRKTFAEMYCDFSNTDLRETISKIECPALILLEGYFKHVKPDIEEQYKELKTASLRYSNKGLHFIMYDDKEWYLTQINDFLNGK